MYRRILVPLDGSSRAEEALPHALLVARCSDSPSITLIQVVTTAIIAVAADPMSPAGAEATAAMQALEAGENAAAGYLKEVAARPDLQGISVQTEVIEGNPGPEIVRYAHENGTDLIVMSTHGRSGLSRLVFGSVADQVLREAGVPILLIRSHRQEESEE